MQKTKTSFREFVRNHTFSEMALGRTVKKLQAPVTPEMMQVAALAHNSKDRGRVLQWLMTTGLYEAAKARDKTTQDLNRWLLGQGYFDDDPVNKAAIEQTGYPKGVVKYNRDKKKFEPYNTAQARGNRGISAYRREGKGFYPVDVFNPEVRAEWEKAGVKIPWDKFDAEYQENLPKGFPIGGQEGRSGARQWFNLDAAREKTGFNFGGPNGYLQAVERGDATDPATKADIDANDPYKQYGPDLSFPEAGWDRNNNPMYYFWGAKMGINRDERRFDDAIVGGRDQFNKIMGKIDGMAQQQNKADLYAQIAQNPSIVDELFPDMNPAEKKELVRIAGIKNMVDKQVTGVSSKANVAGTKYGFTGKPSEANVKVDPQHIPEIDEAVKKGLANFSAKSDPAMLDAMAKVNPVAMRPAGQAVPGTLVTYDLDGNWTLTDDGKTKLYSRIFQNHADGVLARGNRLITALGLKSAGSQGRGWQVTLDSLIEKGLPEGARDAVNKVSYVMKRPQSSVITKELMARKEAADHIIQTLKDHKYQWEEPELQTLDGTPPPPEQIGGKTRLMISKGEHRLPVEWDKASGKWFISWPVESAGTDPVERGRSADITNQAELSGTGTVPFEDDDGAEDTMPAARGREIMDLLAGGKLGENPNGIFDSESVSKGIYNAITQSKNQQVDVPAAKRGEGKKISIGDFGEKMNNTPEGREQLKQWGLEALHSFAWKPQFIVGALTDDEYDTMKNFNIEKKGIDTKLAKHADVLQKHGFTPQTLPAMVHEFARKPNADYNKLFSWLQSLDSTGEILDAFLKQGKQARVRAITLYVMSKIKKSRLEQFMSGSDVQTGQFDKDGESNYVAGQDDQVKSQGDADSTEFGTNITPQELAKKVGIGTPAVSTEIRPAPEGSPSPFNAPKSVPVQQGLHSRVGVRLPLGQQAPQAGVRLPLGQSQPPAQEQPPKLYPDVPVRLQLPKRKAESFQAYEPWNNER